MAFADWTTITNFNMKLFITDKSKGYEIDIGTGWKNPVFMVYFNGIRHNGNISGLCPIVAYGSGANKYKIYPYLYTTKTLSAAYAVSSATTTTFSYPALPKTRKISLAGYLYPINAMPVMNGQVTITILNPTNNQVIQQFTQINIKDNKAKSGYWFDYIVPDAYFDTGVIFKYDISAWRSDTFGDTVLLYLDTDLDWYTTPEGNLKADDYVKKIADDAAITVLVLEYGERGVS